MRHEQNYYVNLLEQNAAFKLSYCLDDFNKRLRIDDYEGSVEAICRRAAEVARANGLTKVFIKARETDWQTFLAKGYMLEGIYKWYFRGCDAYCMAFYLDLARRTSDYWMEEDRILEQVLALPVKTEMSALPADCSLRIAAPGDAGRLAALYGQIFQTYPTPMNDPDYVGNVMQEGTVFYLIESGGGLVSAASAEINTAYGNAEMTDCATLPSHRNQGLMRILLLALEEELVRQGVTCAYSLSRALSFGMNAAFGQMGYRYCGRLAKNCDIYDKFEDMNLWVKRL